MAVDYRERRTVTAAKNRPRKQSISTVVVVFIVVIIAAYGLGVATGWVFFRLSPAPMTVAKPANVQLPVPVSAGSSPPVLPGTLQPSTPTQSPPLTFYDTLPKGEKAVMGSGLNPRAVAPHPQPLPEKPSPPDKPAPMVAQPQKTVPAPAPLGQVPQPQNPASVKKATYAVQLASTKDKADAESIKAKLATKGKSVYIIASQVKDKGIWYRVRVGHNLDEGKAKELAAAMGGGAVMVPE